MSDWIRYDDLVDLVRRHQQSAFSGLITGVSDSKHSFQVGFDQGEIVLLTYRIKKGMQALPLITRIERAKITEHPSTDIQEAGGEPLDTSVVLSQLTADRLDQSTTLTTDISEVSTPRSIRREVTTRPLDGQMKKSIEAAAIHHFGPIGALVCEEYLHADDGDLSSLVAAIAQEVGANEADTEAFYQTISNA